MKKDIKSLTAFILTAVLFTSCSFNGNRTETEGTTSFTAKTAATTATSAQTTADTTTQTTAEITSVSESETEAVSDYDDYPDNDYEDYFYPEYMGEYGTAGKLEGKTVIVSIFANDNVTSWDLEDDKDTMDECLFYMNTAADWITENAARYGSDVSFVCDWKENPDLFYTADFDETLVRFDGTMYYTQSNYVELNVDISGLTQKYRCENMIFFFYFNTEQCDARSWTISYSESYPLHIELTNIFVRFGEEYTSQSASYAHEILHSFGAPDFYYAGETIGQEFVDYCGESYSNDIMYTVNSGDEIIVDFTDLDAYYVGIGERPEIADEWSLGKSLYED